MTMANDNFQALQANLVCLEERRIDYAEVLWRSGRITGLRRLGAERAGLPYLLPGFIDAHVHIESSLLVPTEFARLAVRHGSVACVSDPHEIANVLGVDGVRFMLANARQTPFYFAFGAPSCVPATPFETAGAVLGVAELEALFAEPEVGYLSEMMNYPGVLAGDAEVAAKLALARRLACPVDGHAPGLTGGDARRYARAGITTDHECCSLEEAQAKLAAGMAILIREGSAARNFDTLSPLIASHPEQVMFCSDDKHPDDLAVGHIDRLVARAVAAGYDVFDVLRCACCNPARHYGLPVGLLREGDSMDAILVEDLRHFKVLRTWLHGELVAQAGRSLLPRVPVTPLNRFQARALDLAALRMPAESDTIRVIEAQDGSLITHQQILPARVENGCWLADPVRDILQICVLNRYRPAPPALGFVRNFGLKRGAIASSVAHDSHNLIAVGADPATLCAAINALVARQGGIAVAVDAGRVDVLPLPVAGLMSDDDGDHIAARYAELTALAQSLGSPLRAPFMTLSFMALLVIPELKLSDKGLFDSARFQFTTVAA